MSKVLLVLLLLLLQMYANGKFVGGPHIVEQMASCGDPCIMDMQFSPVSAAVLELISRYSSRDWRRNAAQ